MSETYTKIADFDANNALNLALAAKALQDLGKGPESMCKENYEICLEQVLADVQLTQIIANMGLDLAKIRRVSHLAIFKNAKQLKSFIRDFTAKPMNFHIESIRKARQAPTCYLLFWHVGPIRLSEIITATLLLRLWIHSFGASYDGWEITFKDEEAPGLQKIVDDAEKKSI